MTHPQHLAWQALYPHFGERADFIVSLIAHLLPPIPAPPSRLEGQCEPGQPGLAETGETTGGWMAANEGEK